MLDRKDLREAFNITMGLLLTCSEGQRLALLVWLTENCLNRTQREILRDYIDLKDVHDEEV